MLTPEYLFQDITHITPEFLRQQGIRALLLDVDNTLTAHGSQQLSQPVADWLEQMKAQGVRMVIVSNNLRRRVEPFARQLGLEYISMGCKPLPGGLARARHLLGVRRGQVALVGDQLFTDRLAGCLHGIRGLVVEPKTRDIKKGILFRRKLEKPFIEKYFKQGGKLL